MSRTDTPAIAVKNLSLSRGSRPVLRDVEFTVAPGQVAGLLGPSGSGKSTLLRCVNRLLEPPPGTVFVEGEDVTGLDVIALRRRVGMVFQQPVVFPGTVADNLRYGPALANEPLEDHAVRRLLTVADLDPDLATQPASELSGGQAQRVALARTLANRPSILLLDEPTSALDPASRRHVEETVLRAVAQEGLTVLWVTHDVDQASHVADTLFLLVDGQIRDRGAPDHVLHPHADHVHLLTRFAQGELESAENEPS